MADEVEVNGIWWSCEVAEPRYGNVRPCWSAALGPATILAREYRASGLAPWWAVRLDCGEERRDEGEAHGSAGEAMAAAGPWALGLLREWRDLGALAGQALAAAGGQ